MMPVASALAGLPGRFGQLLVAPRAALRRVEGEGGGLRDALWLVALGAVCLRFPQLAEAVLGLAHVSQGALLRVVGVFSNEARDAALVVIPATLAITILAGRHRDATLDLELGACCFAPFFVVRGVERVLVRLGDLPSGSLPAALAYAPAVAWAALVCWKGLQTAWARRVGQARAEGSAAVLAAEASPAAEPLATSGALAPAAAALAPAAAALAPAPGATPAAGALAPASAALAPEATAVRAGFLALAILVGGLGANIVWAQRHLDALRPMEHGEAAPDFNLPRADGQSGRLSLSELRGKVVLLDFWATWCPPCIQMIPVLHELHRDFSPRGVEIVGVDSDGPQSTPADVLAFLQRHPAPYPIVIDDQGSANALYKIRALPQMVLIGRDGAVRGVFIGYTSRSDLAAAFTAALEDGPAP
jgi:cytochrome c biogenesis protein CcmG/thiol:disulfide interchange protein DsbE